MSAVDSGCDLTLMEHARLARIHAHPKIAIFGQYEEVPYRPLHYFGHVDKSVTVYGWSMTGCGFMGKPRLPERLSGSVMLESFVIKVFTIQ